ncbi:MucR-family transcriptional regulator [Sphingomonas sp. LH128]|uniref:MucR family transcriptional regulator n=1 Tax=Sphingomonas sp. LH128 TaxID=473781 RepID=UPI00027CB1EE|nr:MucR family transcriptional regulator [Sphingomonas sp. LH128]EJU12123.1 MucR-family transcriptional regulator [Sphingomonas sp. LH128]
MADEHRDLLTTLTVDIVSAFVSNNAVRSDDVAGLIASTHAALAALGGADAASVAAEPEHVPAVTVRKSLADRDRIVSMIDGKPYRSLKRHLGAHGLTPDEYRARYKLPASYPMVAPGYSEARSAVAKKLGLGRKPRAVTPSKAVGPARKPRAKLGIVT